MTAIMTPRMVRRAAGLGALLGAGVAALVAHLHGIDRPSFAFAGALWGAAIVLTAAGARLPTWRRSSRGRRAS
ncbi:hypothetical protein V5G24_23225 [Xanthobacter sp. VTT E-85241]|uniref:hypothetical protein n=1 Tax=Roseixanthobacter finlandensis TaxID=3119922 RepID=UPI0037268F67